MKRNFSLIETIVPFVFILAAIVTVIGYVNEIMWLVRTGYVCFITATVMWFFFAILQPNWWVITIKKESQPKKKIEEESRLRFRSIPTTITLTVVVASSVLRIEDGGALYWLLIVFGGMITIMMATIWFTQWFDFHRK